MSIPDNRNKTYVAGNRFARADLLWVQDNLVAMYLRRRRPLRTLRLTGLDTIEPRAATSGWPVSGSTMTWSLRSLPVGARIHRIQASVRRTAGTLEIDLRRSPNAAPASASVAAATGGTAGVWAAFALSFSYPYHRTASGYAYTLRLTRGAGADQFAAVEIEYDIP